MTKAIGAKVRRGKVRAGSGMALAATAATAWSGPASAQAASAFADYLFNDTAIIRPAIPAGFSRGRNEGVLEHPNPDYQPLGIPVSSFTALPRIDVSLGATNNTFATANSVRTSSAFSVVDPSLAVTSNWSRNKLGFTAALDQQNYFGNSRRDQTNYAVGATGELQIGNDFVLAGEADGSRQFESPFAGGVQSTLAVLSSFKTSYFSGRGTYQAGRVRAIAAVDHTALDFASLDLGGGVRQSRRFRDRDVTRFSGQLEYALSPSVSVYGQGAYDQSSYSTALPNGAPNRDSDGFRASGGVNVDIAGLARGTLAVGYVRRMFDAARYKSVQGPSVEAVVELFPSYLTTVTLRYRRFLEDSSFGSNLPFFDNRVSLTVDHSILRNLLVRGTLDYGRLQYLEAGGQNRTTYRANVGGTYMASRRFGLRANVGYGRQTTESIEFGAPFNEVRGQVGVYVQQ